MKIHKLLNAAVIKTMDHIRNIVTEVERVLGSAATPEQVEALARLVLEQMHKPDRGGAGPKDAHLSARDRGVVTASGPNGHAILALLSNALADAGAVIEEVSQTVRNGIFSLALRVDISEINMSLLDLRRRLQGVAAREDVRVSVHRSDLYAAMTSF